MLEFRQPYSSRPSALGVEQQWRWLLVAAINSLQLQLYALRQPADELHRSPYALGDVLQMHIGMA